MSMLDGIQGALSSKASEETQEFLLEHIDSEAVQFGMEVGVESVFNSIPGVGATIATYRNKKQMRNLVKFTEEINKRIDDIQKAVKSNQDDQEKIDAIVNSAIDRALKSEQEEKIEFIVYGLENILENKEISFDVASLYFDTIDRLTLLDIAVLKYYRTPFNPKTGEARDIDKLLETFNIPIEIFHATKSNLRTIGLLETKTDKNIGEDITNVYKTLSTLSEKVNLLNDAIKDPKKVKKIKDQTVKTKKVQSKDTSYEMSKFGRDFHDYFIDENPFK